MIKKIMMLGVLMAFLSTTTYVFAENVFTTQRGAKYHKEICRLVKNKDNVSTLEKKQAIEDGYDPCKRCFKEDVVIKKESGK